LINGAEQHHPPHDLTNVWGLPYKIFVSALGLVIVMLAVTGVLIWWRSGGERKKIVAPKFGLKISIDNT
jgi:hypothetical protein